MGNTFRTSTINRGKSFEARFEKDFKSCFPEGSIDRLKDQVSKNKHTSRNICDFVGYVYPNIFYLECKSHHGKYWNFSLLTQYDEMISKVGIHGVRAGVVLWLEDFDKVLYIPISTITEMKKNGEKSININKLDLLKSLYNIIDIPSTKKVVYMTSDYSFLKNLKDGE